jgi:MFS family permease
VVIVAGLAVCSAAVWALSGTTSPGAVAVAVVTYAAGVATTTAATSAFITDITRRARYGAAHGVFGTIYDIGDAFGPIAAGLLVTAVGYGAMFRVMAVLGLTAAVAFSILSRRSHADADWFLQRFVSSRPASAGPRWPLATNPQGTSATDQGRGPEPRGLRAGRHLD